MKKSIYWKDVLPAIAGQQGCIAMLGWVWDRETQESTIMRCCLEQDNQMAIMANGQNICHK